MKKIWTDGERLRGLKRKLIKISGRNPETLTIEDLALSNLQLEGQIETLQKQLSSPFYDYKNKILRIPDKGSISFKTKRGRKYQSTLFEILFELWLENGPIKVDKGVMIRSVSMILKEDWDRDKLKNNLRHLSDKFKNNPNLPIYFELQRNTVTFSIQS